VTDFADFNEATPFIHAVDDAVITDSQPPFVFPAPHLLPARREGITLQLLNFFSRRCLNSGIIRRSAFSTSRSNRTSHILQRLQPHKLSRFHPPIGIIPTGDELRFRRQQVVFVVSEGIV